MRVLITGGGTGGHINPALAIARELRERDPGLELLYVGTRVGLEADLVPRAGIEFRTITVSGVIRKSPLQAALGVLRAGKGFLEARGIIRQFRPDVVVGTGGYVSGPVMLAAAMLGVPTLLQEQNAFPGVTNRILSRWVARVALAFEEARRYVSPRSRPFVTGNPIRRDILAAEREASARELGLDPGKRTILVTGGSRGAGSFAKAVPELAAAVRQRPDLQLIWGTGKQYYDAARHELERRGIWPLPGNIVMMPYIYRQDLAMAASDLAVVRAGALTLAELTARGLPSVIIPSPNVTHNHQVMNARVLSSAGAADVILESDLTGQRLVDRVLAIIDSPERLKQMATRSRALGKPNATSDIADAVLALVRR
ncbi:MAG: undecaprenyldiphospho-muramoylpentapeptide beta-N-acetylglucosaminyltransferase [Chloroflexota bacterium]